MGMEQIEISSGRSTLRLIHADCLAVLPTLPEASVDLVVTSPPYNIGTRYVGYDDTAPRADYLDWCDRWAREIARLLARKGSFFLNVAGKPSDPCVPFDLLAVMRRHFRVQNVIHWVKSIALPREVGLPKSRVIGHYKPINSRRYLNDCHEYLFHLTHSGDVPLDRLAIGVPYEDKSNVTRWRRAASDRHCRGNVWFIPYPTIQRRDRDRPHPASFPPELAEWCFRLHGLDRIRLALDPFLGIGSAAVAAATLGLSFLGIELTDAYYTEAVARVREAVASCGVAGG